MPEHITFLLTEVVDSVQQWEADEVSMAAATDRLDRVVGILVGQHHGQQVKPRGEGDSHFLIFRDPADAVAFSVALQVALSDETALAVRSGCNVGPAELRDGDWYGTTVNRCARLRAAANASQSLVSAEVVDALKGSERHVPDGVSLRSLGRHRLKDLDEPVEVFQVCAPGLRAEHPPLATLTRSHGLSLPRSSFVGRSSDLDRVVGLLRRDAVVVITGPPGAGTTRLAMEAAAAWWEGEGRAVRVVASGSAADIGAARSSEGELVLVDETGLAVPWSSLSGPAILTTRFPPHAAGPVTLRLSPLDEMSAELLLHDRLGGDTSLPPEVVGHCSGLPLAIELLARRAASVDSAVLAQRIARDPLAILGGDRRADPPRHASMRATLWAAFEVLDDTARSDLRSARPGDPRWVAAGWHEPDGPVPLIAAFLEAPAGPG